MDINTKAPAEKLLKGYYTVEELMNLKKFNPDSRVYIEEAKGGILIHPSAHDLRRIYIEPTNICNLGCRTCIRNVWDEPMGNMEPEIFEKVLEAVRESSPRPEVFFGGFGEPLSHPDILKMVKQAKDAGAVVELITNGILLDKPMAEGLIDAGLDFLWVSIDGASPESYLDVRLGDELPRIIENLKDLRRLRYAAYSKVPRLGIAFVAMKRNIKDLPEVVALGRKLGARKFHISNLIPYTEDMKSEILYNHSVWKGKSRIEQFIVPRMDADEELMRALGKTVLKSDWTNLFQQDFRRPIDTCPFADKGSVSVRWDGKVSPCPPLLHEHENFLEDTQRTVNPYFAGSLEESPLLGVWNDEAYANLREKLQDFDFSPCTECNSCEMAEGNEEDCFGSTEPACGGCLWAQGFISCP